MCSPLLEHYVFACIYPVSFSILFALLFTFRLFLFSSSFPCRLFMATLFLSAIVGSKLTSGATFWEAFVSFTYLFSFMIPTRSGSPCIARICWAWQK